jgi:hypothetical protein
MSECFTDDDVDRLLSVAPGQSREYAATLLAAVAPAIAARAVAPYRAALMELRGDFQRVSDIAGQHTAKNGETTDE